MADPIRNEESSQQQIDRARAAQAAGNDDPQTTQREIEKLDAETAEELDALHLNLLQDDDFTPKRDSSGRVVDEVAEETLARFTEVGPMAEDRGAISVTPGRDDPSRALRSHQVRPEAANADEAVDDNLDEPRDDAPNRRRDTAA